MGVPQFIVSMTHFASDFKEASVRGHRPGCLVLRSTGAKQPERGNAMPETGQPMGDYAIGLIRAAWARLRPEIEQHYRVLWSNPELPMMEYQAAAGLSSWLEGHGFAVERGTCGLPTAFKARFGAGQPAIALLAEYDALPGQANAAVPHRRAEGRGPGHACGHNQIGPSNIGAAIAARYAMEQLGLDGQIVVLGCPAEEIVWGKIALLKGGAFEGLSAILTSHGDQQNGAVSRPCLAGFGGEFVFQGVAGHAGRVRRQNALEAAELAVQTFERLRAHHFADVSVEHVLRNGGLMPNITPDEARLWVFVRHLDYDRAGEVYDYLVGLCRNAAEVTGTGFAEFFISATRGYLPNDVLAQVLYRNMTVVGPPRWSAADIAWMADLSAACRPSEDMRLHREVGYFSEGVDPYGQDDGEASWYVPLARANWAVPEQVPFHSWALTALTGSPASHAGPLMASEALALTAIDLLTDPKPLREAASERDRRVAGYQLTPPRLDAFEVLTRTPERFWDATWVLDHESA